MANHGTGLPTAADLQESAALRCGTGISAPFPRADEIALERLLGALGEAELTAFGRYIASEELQTATESRLRFDVAYERECAKARAPRERNRAPIVIAGLPRTGTTLLHMLLDRVPKVTTIKHWQARWPAAVLEGDDACAVAREECARRLHGFDRLVPSFQAIHPMDVDLPEECNVALQRSFLSVQYAIMFPIPSYASWLASQDLRAAYARLAIEVAAVTEGADSDQLVLKSPAHILDYGALADVYPGATVVQIHRPVEEWLPSWCSLVAHARSSSTNADRGLVGPEWLAFWREVLQRSADVLEGRSLPLHFLRCEYDDLVADPVGLVRRILDAHGLRCRVVDLEMSAPRSAAHEYNGRDFGLDELSSSRELEWLADRVLNQGDRV